MINRTHKKRFTSSRLSNISPQCFEGQLHNKPINDTRRHQVKSFLWTLGLSSELGMDGVSMTVKEGSVLQ